MNKLININIIYGSNVAYPTYTHHYHLQLRHCYNPHCNRSSYDVQLLECIAQTFPEGKKYWFTVRENNKMELDNVTMLTFGRPIQKPLEHSLTIGQRTIRSIIDLDTLGTVMDGLAVPCYTVRAEARTRMLLSVTRTPPCKTASQIRPCFPLEYGWSCDLPCNPLLRRR